MKLPKFVLMAAATCSCLLITGVTAFAYTDIVLPQSEQSGKIVSYSVFNDEEILFLDNGGSVEELEVETISIYSEEAKTILNQGIFTYEAILDNINGNDEVNNEINNSIQPYGHFFDTTQYYDISGAVAALDATIELVPPGDYYYDRVYAYWYINNAGFNHKASAKIQSGYKKCLATYTYETLDAFEPNKINRHTFNVTFTAGR